MPLLAMSANIQELDCPGRKRSHDEFAGSAYDEPPGVEDGVGDEDGGDTEKRASSATVADVGRADKNARQNPPSPTPAISTTSPPAQSSPASLTDAGSSTPAGNTPSPNHTPKRRPSTSPSPESATAAAPGQKHTQAAMPPKSAVQSSAASPGQPPAKRKRLTATEKEAKAQADAAKKQEREEAKAAKAAADAAKKQEREEARTAKAAERAKVEEEKKARQEERDRKKREKEDEERRIQEEKERKKRSQLKLGAFFKSGPATPSKKAADAPVQNGDAIRDDTPDDSPKKATTVGAESAYRKMFKPFFVKEQVTLAVSPFSNDDETKAVKSNILDEYISEARGHFDPRPFNPVESLHLASLPPPRGRIYPSVSKIMAEYSGGASGKPVDLTTESQNSLIKQTTSLLQKVPMKFLGFREDVRPPYYGTVTSAPPSGSLRRLGRNPLSKDVLPLNYDYDSEAEWVDDGDGDDLEALDDEEEDADEDEEMGDFLDDSEDTGPARVAFSAGMVPESTGLCWENRQRLGPLPHMYKFRMEFILENLDHHSGIDPFSTKYWEPEPKPAKAVLSETTKNPSSKAHAIAPPPVPSDAFSALTSGGANGRPADGAAAAKKGLVPAEFADDFKRAVLEYPALSKVGLVELLSVKFPKCTKAQVRGSLDAMAEQVGAGRAKEWKLRAGYEL